MRPQDWLLRYMEYSFQKTSEGVYSSPQYLLEPDPEAILLDCGTHKGIFSSRLGEILGTEKIYGLEINQPLAREAVQKGVRVTIADLNGFIPLASDSIDALTSFNLLEHLVETQRYIQEIYRVIKPGGYAIINTPNLASWHNIVALLLGLQPFSGPNISSMTESDIPIVRRMHRRAHQMEEHQEAIQVKEPERYRHIVVVAYRSLLLALEQTGFQIERALGFGYYPLPPILARIACKINPSHAHHMVIKARKPKNAGPTQ